MKIVIMEYLGYSFLEDPIGKIQFIPLYIHY